ncbi:hypothetical protein B0H13DRAFT_2371136 [Mycena leptocephala]|nr:hypothetical protein B0H13DRAFT_2371136 [Mycena leptocephala]
MSPAIHVHLLRGCLEFLRSSRTALSGSDLQWLWVPTADGFIAHKKKRSGSAPIIFTIFGVIATPGRPDVLVLEKPDWQAEGSVGKEFNIRFDMQLLTMSRVMEHHGWDPADDSHIVVTYAGATYPIGSTIFATATLTVKDVTVESDDEPYILDLVSVEAMYERTN